MSSLYLYAIVDSPPPSPLGVLEVVRAGGAHVIVEKGSPRKATPANMKKHDLVVRRLARACSAVLPFRFGSMVPDRKSLAALLDPIAPAIDRALDEVYDAVQFTLRVYGKAAPRAKAKRSEGPGTRFMQQRLRAHRVPEIDSVTEATRPFVRSARAQRHDREPLLASVYHLVPREHVRRYRAALASSSKALAGVRVEATGPWPPYAFAEVP